MTEHNGHMLAAVLYDRESMKVEQVAIPTPGVNDVLVRVKAALTCGTDLKVCQRGEVSASDFVTGEISFNELPGLFQHMKNRNGQLKVAVRP